ncbi:MAG: hypothetical protein A3D94_06225 [Alphaproteobacteria bacterium RIFCSPHIGHO2_12_FULL_66_14]|jgi:hypothetical protein|nr:MAG: hypothetical protein A3D94_06225 [Alphaproteobacteria bacterium RIFCSPHIGHO2_12_FULL_66_14]
MNAESLDTLVDRYCAAWNTPDGAERRRILHTVLTDGGLYVDPSVRAVGVESLAAHIDGVAHRNPGARISRTGPIDAHHEVLRFDWSNRLADGRVLRRGVDFCTIAADGRFLSIVGFFTPVP